MTRIVMVAPVCRGHHIHAKLKGRNRTACGLRMRYKDGKWSWFGGKIITCRRCMKALGIVPDVVVEGDK